MSTDNLILTEHAIKRHAKRLQKQMKNYSQDLSLGESQNLLSKILGFNDWNHLNTILKPTIEKCEKDTKIVNFIKKSMQKTGVIISSNELICKSIQLFFKKGHILGEDYTCQTFENIESYKKHIQYNKQSFDFIICDIEFNFNNINNNCPIIYLTNETKTEVFYKTMSKLFFAKKNIEAINELKKYINENKGEVDFKYWKLLLKLYQESSDRKEFDKTVLIFSNKFDLEEKFSFDNFSFIPEEDYKNYFLSKPFSKEDLFKIIYYVESDI